MPSRDKERLDLALEATGMDLWENDLVTGIVTRKAAHVYAELGYSEQEAASLVKDIFKIVHPDDIPSLQTAIADHLAGRSTTYRCEFRLRTKHSGQWVWYANYGKIIDTNEEGRRFIGVTFNISDRKTSEERLQRMFEEVQRLSMLYQAFREVSLAIVRMKTEGELLPLVCRTVVDLGGMALATVSQVNTSTNRIESIAHYGIGSDYLGQASISADPSLPEGRGPSGRSFREGKSIIIQKFQEDEMTRPWHDIARRFGWNSCGTFPILRAGKTFAILVVYHGRVDAFDKQSVKLLEDAVREISFALDNFDRDRERQKARADLMESERHFRAYFERAMFGMAATLPNKGWLEVNDALCHMLGYTREELLQKTWADITHPDDIEEGIRLTDRVLRGELNEFEQYTRYLRKDQRIIHAHVAERAVRNGHGEVEYFVILIEDLTELKEHQIQLEFQAYHDPLTGLPNRALLNDRLDMAVSYTNRSGGDLAVCFIDLDGFKEVNDTYGHTTGDTLLVETAQRLMAVARSTDTVARLGGDEFILILTDISGDQECMAILQRVMEDISQPYEIAGKNIQISTSIGVAMYPDNLTDGSGLLRKADQAMYLAKQQGRQLIHFFDNTHDLIARTHTEELTRLKQALIQDELVLYYQPQVNMRTGAIIGLEALIRWRHPERKVLLPGEFLPLVENSEFEINLSEWVIRQALNQLNLWQKQGLSLKVCINLPARHLQSRRFVPFITSALSDYPDLPKGVLKFEILETVAIGDMSSAIQKMELCIEAGAAFSIDDFGTGYASLSYLRRLPVDTLKIDQSFVHDMLTDPDDLSIVKGVIGLADAFQKTVIAEGVETAEHGAKLLSMGCELGQGHGISRPMPEGDVLEWVCSFSAPPEWT